MQNYLRMSKSIAATKKVARLFGDYDNFAGYQNIALRNFKRPGVTLVRDKRSAREVIDTLYKYKDR